MPSRSILPTPVEIIGTLKRSFLVTILVEGTSDTFVYRRLRSLCKSDPMVTMLYCGGRNRLFEVFSRRAEFESAKVVFIADLDSYRFDGIPDEYEEIVFTSGYCVENDIYHGSKVCNLLEPDEITKLDKLRELIGTWVAFELESHNARKLAGHNSTLAVSKHINQVCPTDQEICPKFRTAISYSEPKQETVQHVFSEYDLNVRGKQLFQMVARYLSVAGRRSKFSVENLIEVAISQEPSNCFLSLGQRLDSAVQAQI